MVGLCVCVCVCVFVCVCIGYFRLGSKRKQVACYQMLGKGWLRTTTGKFEQRSIILCFHIFITALVGNPGDWRLDSKAS